MKPETYPDFDADKVPLMQDSCREPSAEETLHHYNQELATESMMVQTALCIIDKREKASPLEVLKLGEILKQLNIKIN